MVTGMMSVTVWMSVLVTVMLQGALG